MRARAAQSWPPSLSTPPPSRCSLDERAITITIASIDAAPAVASLDAAGAAQSRPEDASTGLSTGALVAIVIAAVVGVVLVLLVVVYLCKRRSLGAAKPKFNDIYDGDEG